MNSTPANKIDVQFRRQGHPFHILHPSKLPFLTGLFALCFVVPLIFYMHGLPLPFLPELRADMMHLSFLGLYGTLMHWFISVVKESSQGFHTKKVQQGLRLGMILFIVSEVMFFFAIFWAFFHVSLVPSIAIGNVWPPFGTQELSPWGLPLVNTLLLLASGVTITIAHAYLIKNNNDGFFFYLFLTIVLGVTFLYCQAYEYKYGVKFSWRDNIYGSIFFMSTGFHGLHVTIGTMFLTFCWTRHLLTTILPANLQEGRNVQLVKLLTLFGYAPQKGFRWAMTSDHHFGFEAAAWYWHFVDVVWLFLFLTVYCWGGK